MLPPLRIRSSDRAAGSDRGCLLRWGHRTDGNRRRLRNSIFINPAPVRRRETDRQTVFGLFFFFFLNFTTAFNHLARCDFPTSSSRDPPGTTELRVVWFREHARRYSPGTFFHADALFQTGYYAISLYNYVKRVGGNISGGNVSVTEGEQMQLYSNATAGRKFSSACLHV